MGIWFVVALLASLIPIVDLDLGFHIAWGRNLLHDFRGAGSMLLGQDASATVWAYGYWLYEITVAWLFDHAGTWGLVAMRIAIVLAMFAIAFLLAGRLGASRWTRAILLAFGVVVAHERFADRPDVFSNLPWLATLWILALHRHDRGRWTLVPLLVLWTNTHHHFSFMFLAVGAFAIGDAVERRLDVRRFVPLVLALLAATLVNPVGLGVWRSQLNLLGGLRGMTAPLPIQELIGAYASYQPYPALWAFRFGMPVCLMLAIAGRRRIGWGALFVLLGSAALAILARRALPLFAVTAVALVPPALDALAARLPAGAIRRVRGFAVAVVAVAGTTAVLGLINGRILLAEDKLYRIGAPGPLPCPATGAARFLREWNIQGPIFHDPPAAGAILMEDWGRLVPFLDARWCGTPETNRIFVALSLATDSTVGRAWEGAMKSRGFEVALLDPDGMPELFRHLAEHPDWPLVYYDDRAAVFCRRGGRNAAAIAALEPRIAASWPQPDTARAAKLGREALRFLHSHPPPLWAPLEFPSRSFRLAKFGVQVGSRDMAQQALFDLFEHERGSLHASHNRANVLYNTLWSLSNSREWEARAALCEALLEERAIAPDRRRRLRLEQAEILLELRKPIEAERAAAMVIGDPGASTTERWLGSMVSAHARLARGDAEGALRALRDAAGIRPDAPETWREIGNALERLGRRAEALQAYETFRSLGGRDEGVEERVRQ